MQQTNPTEVWDAAFEALSHPIQRQIVTQVKARNQVYADNVLADLMVDELTASATPAVPVTRVHLPKLAEAEFIDWYRGSGVTLISPNT